MAKQAGPHLLEGGSVGNSTFTKHPDDGHLVRQKSSLDRNRVMRDPNFEYTLYNAAEFGRAIAGGASLRFAWRPVLKTVADRKLSGRMNALFLKIVKSDTQSHWGERCLQRGQAGLAEGFNFNKHSKLVDVLPLYCTHHIDTATGYMYTKLPSFIPRQTIQATAYSHFNIVSVGASLDFVTGKPARYARETGMIAIDRPYVPALRLEHSVATKAGSSLFLALGVLFYALPADIPDGVLSKTKRRRLGNGDLPVPYTGALQIVRVATATDTAAAT